MVASPWASMRHDCQMPTCQLSMQSQCSTWYRESVNKEKCLSGSFFPRAPTLKMYT